VDLALSSETEEGTLLAPASATVAIPRTGSSPI
jgi:hypothetical protein